MNRCCLGACYALQMTSIICALALELALLPRVR
jgi:hypothetical protein